MVPRIVSIGQSALANAKWEDAKEQFESALMESDSPEAHDGLGLALWWLNEIPESHEQRTLAYRGYKSSGDLPKAARLAAWLAREQVFLRANVSAMNGWFARRYQCSFLSAYCRTTYGSLLAETGKWQDAETALTEAIHTFDEGHRGLRVNALLKLADLRVSQGRLEEAEVLLGGYEDYGSSVLPRARLHLARGESELAKAVLERALQSDSSPSLHRAPLLRLLVDVFLTSNDLESARRVADELVSLSKLTASNLFLAQSELALGQISRYSNEEDAVKHFRAALDHLDVHQGSVLACRVKLELARTLKDTDRAGAITWAKAAFAGFERIGAAHDADETNGLLREMGAAVKANVRSQDQLLTTREAEVLELLSHGLSDREIASRLVVSAKTVEHHVGQVLGKLGLRNRSEAAAYFLNQRSSPADKK